MQNVTLDAVFFAVFSIVILGLLRPPRDLEQLRDHVLRLFNRYKDILHLY